MEHGQADELADGGGGGGAAWSSASKKVESGQVWLREFKKQCHVTRSIHRSKQEYHGEEGNIVNAV